MPLVTIELSPQEHAALARVAQRQKTDPKRALSALVRDHLKATDAAHQLTSAEADLLQKFRSFCSEVDGWYRAADLADLVPTEPGTSRLTRSIITGRALTALADRLLELDSEYRILTRDGGGRQRFYKLIHLPTERAALTETF